MNNLFKLDKSKIITKLRPFVHTFLEEASKLFEMYIYTKGARGYALEMAELLDPQNKYFHSRIISREDSTHEHQKGLDIIFGRESTILVVDDSVWVRSLILILASSIHVD